MTSLTNHYSKIAGSAIVMLALIAVGGSSSYTMLMSDADTAYAITHDVRLESTVLIDGDLLDDRVAESDASFGRSFDVLGDLDGDGTRDFAVGVPGAFSCHCSGEVYVLFMNDDGTIRDTALINADTPNGPSVQEGDRFGVSLSALGDIAGDGTIAIAVGSSGHITDDVASGDVYIIFLNPDGTIKQTTEINASTPNGPDLGIGDQFGASIANLGDLDGDGVVDIGAGAPGHVLHSVHTGDVYVMFMNSNGTVKQTTEINSDTPNGPSVLHQDDEFGISMSTIGDLDGNGVDEIAVGAAGSPVADIHEGSLYILFMNSDNTIISTSVIGPDTPNGPNLMNGDAFGEAVAGIGDIDGDGVPDIAVGAPGQFATTNAGELHILMMNSNGTIKSTTTIESGTPNGPMLETGDHFAISIRNMGDLDGDNINDIMVGTRGDDTIYFIQLSADGTPKATTELHGRDVIPTLYAPSDHFGWSVANIGDLDNDGTPDIAVGSPGTRAGGAPTGYVEILLMNSDGTVKSATLINGDTPNGPALAVGDRFGASVSGIGDLDGNGAVDIAVGAPGHFENSESTGDAYILFMNNDATIKSTVDLGASNTTTNGPVLVANDRFGESVSTIGDIDGDNITDIIVGAPGHAVRGVATGDAYILFLNADGTPKSTVEIGVDTPNGPAIAVGDRFGWSATGIGDLDGDGTPDIAVGAPGRIIGSTVAGTIHIILLTPDGTPKTSITINDNTPNGPSTLEVGDRFGSSIGTISDLDNDGIAEIVVGALGDLVVGTGKVHILFPNSDGTLKDSAVIDTETPNGPTLAPGDHFGASVAGLGDLDGNGAPEIIVGTSDTDTLHVMFTSTTQAPLDTVQIGAILPLTKNDAPHTSGTHREFAVHEAVSDFNDYLAGTDASWRISVDVRDSKGLQSSALSQAIDLHSNNDINFIVGPSFSSNVGAILTQYINPNNISDLALVSPSSTSPLWALDDNIFRLALADDKAGPLIANHLYQDGKRVIIPVWVNDPFGIGLAKSTVDEFREIGGMAIYSDDPDSAEIIRTYDRCSDTYTTCIEDQFPDMAAELASTTAEYIKMYGSDRVAIVFVGFELPDFIAEVAENHPILRTVQWVGSDADVLDPLLAIDGSDVKQFMLDVGFMTHVFAGSPESARHMSLTESITQAFPTHTFSTYTYSSYDTVWAVGLAIEAAGGPSSSFDEQVAQIKPAVDNNDQGALGDITLNEFGDIESGDYAIWSIKSTGWELLGKYTSYNAFLASNTYDPTPTHRVGALLNLDPTGVSFLDDEYALVMALAKLDYNNANPDGTQIDIRTIDTRYGPLPALNKINNGTYDDFYYPQIRQVIDDTIAVYDTHGSFDPINDSVVSGLYPFTINSAGIIAHHGSDSRLIGQYSLDLIYDNDRPLSDFRLFTDSDDPPSELWLQYSFTNPDTGDVGIKRSLITYHEPSGLLVGAGYYPVVGGDSAYEPVLDAIISDAVQLVSNNNYTITSLQGTYDGVSSPFYAFVLDTSGDVVANSLQAATSVGVTNIASLKDIDKSIQQINELLVSDGDTTWLGYTFYNPATGMEDPKRALLKLVTLDDGQEFIFGTGYYPPIPITSFVGPTTSQHVNEVIDYINNDSMADYVLISPSSTADSLAINDNIFRLKAVNSAQISPLVDMMTAEAKSHIVIVASDDVWAQDLTNLVINDGSFEEYVVLEPTIPIIHPESVNYTSVVTQLESQISASTSAAGGDPDSVGVLYVLFASQTAPLFDTIDMLDRSSPIFAVDGYVPDSVLDHPDSLNDIIASRVAAEMNLISPFYAVDPNPVNEMLNDRLAPLGVIQSPTHSSMYDTITVLASSVASSTDQYSVRDILADNYDNDNDNNANIPDSASIFPFIGALDSDTGITLNSAGDLVAVASDYPPYRVSPSSIDTGTDYVWEAVVPGTVFGTVYADINNNARIDHIEPGIAGVDVVLPLHDSMTDTTDSDGSFTFYDLDSGQLLVQLASIPELHKPSDDSLSYQYDTVSSVRSILADFALYPITPSSTATITGKVYSDMDDNIIFDGQDMGLPEQTVYVADFLTMTSKTSLTDQNGDYIISGILPDAVLVQLLSVPAGHLKSTGSNTYHYMDLNEGSTTSVDFALTPVPESDTASIQGVVYQDNNSNGIQDAGEPGIPDSIVFVFELLTAQQQTIFTDTDGMYSFAGILPDTVLLQHIASHPSTMPTAPQGGYTYLDLDAGQNIVVNFANSGILSSPVDTLQASTSSDTRIDLTWTEPAMSPLADDDDDTIIGYKIEVESPPGTGFGPVTYNTETTQTWYYHTGLQPDTQYNYRVSPITEAGASSVSNVATATTQPAS